MKKRNLIISLSAISLALAGGAVGITYASFQSQANISQTAGMNRYIFLDVSYGDWSAYNPKYYMYAWASADGAHQWFPASSTTKGGYYWFYIPSTYTGCLFVRANPNKSYAEVQAWGEAIWNQTTNISFVNDKNVWKPTSVNNNVFSGEWILNYSF